MSPSAERLKVHRRSLDLGGLHHTALSPRPGDGALVAGDGRPDAPSVVTDVVGSHLLGRLCWAMAYQRHDRTLVVIEDRSAPADPSGADPASAVVIVNSDLGSITSATAAALAAALPFTTPSDGTVVLQTRGLDVALGDPAAFRARDDQAEWRDRSDGRGRIGVQEGLVVIEAPSAVLRAWGVVLSGVVAPSHDGDGQELVAASPAGHSQELVSLPGTTGTVGIRRS